MRCGNKRVLGDHEHETAAEVRACYGFGQKTDDNQDDTPPSREEVFGGAVPVQTSPLASPKQRSYLNDLRVERGMDPLPPDAQLFTSVASATIAQLLLVKPRVKQAATVTYANVPAGYYAIPGRDGRELDFYRVDRPEEGRWKGRIFLNMVIGGKSDAKIKDRNRIAEVLAAIAVNPEEAAWRYGQKIKRCDKCNMHLTDETSRMFSRGPDCRAKHGVGYMGTPHRVRQERPAGAPAPSRPARRAS